MFQRKPLDQRPQTSVWVATTATALLLLLLYNSRDRAFCRGEAAGRRSCLMFPTAVSFLLHPPTRPVCLFLELPRFACVGMHASGKSCSSHHSSRLAKSKVSLYLAGCCLEMKAVIAFLGRSPRTPPFSLTSRGWHTCHFIVLALTNQATVFASGSFPYLLLNCIIGNQMDF